MSGCSHLQSGQDTGFLGVGGVAPGTRDTAEPLGLGEESVSCAHDTTHLTDRWKENPACDSRHNYFKSDQPMGSPESRALCQPCECEEEEEEEESACCSVRSKSHYMLPLPSPPAAATPSIHLRWHVVPPGPAARASAKGLKTHTNTCRTW